MTSLRLRDLQEKWAKEGKPHVDDVANLDLRPGLNVARFCATDLLLDVDGGATLSEIHDAATANSAYFPLLGAAPDLTIAQVCASIPIFVEGFVSNIDAIDGGGHPLSTPRAPRSAQGPDLIGALLTNPPLAVCVRAQVRCASATTTARYVLRTNSPEEAAQITQAFMRDGRAVSVCTTSRAVWACTHALPPDIDPDRASRRPLIAASSTSSEERAEEELLEQELLTPDERQTKRSGRMLPSFDVETVRSVLQRGAVVVGAPQMGRLGTIEDGRVSRPLVDTDRAARTLSAALRSAGKEVKRW